MKKRKDTTTMVSIIISRAIDVLAASKTQRQLAREMGFAKPNMLSMIKTGEANVPFAKIPIVARVLNIDPAFLLRTYLREEWGDNEMVVFSIFGGILTVAEREWLKIFESIELKLPPANPAERQCLIDILNERAWEPTSR